jgi:hypothetical protein
VGAVSATIVQIVEVHDDGSYTLRHYGPVGPGAVKLIEAFAGPVRAEQIMPAAEVKAHEALGYGVTVYHLDGL